jgi:hypothetical protein
MHYCLCSGGTGTYLTKSELGHVTAKFYFCDRWGLSVIVHSGTSGVQNIDTLFFILGQVRYGFHKKRARMHYSELVFLHLVGSTGHVVHSGE